MGMEKPKGMAESPVASEGQGTHKPEGPCSRCVQQSWVDHASNTRVFEPGSLLDSYADTGQAPDLGFPLYTMREDLTGGLFCPCLS